MNPGKFKIVTLGCKVNQYDSQVIREGLERLGYEETKDEGLAEICIVNTCTVTKTADSKSRYQINKLAKNSKPNAEIIVTGCMAEVDKQAVLKIPGVSRVVSKDEKFVVGKYVNPITARGAAGRTPCGRISDFRDHCKAFVKVQDGCERFCSYCKVPFARGKSRSRNQDEIINEVKELVNNGFKEIIITGICLGDYGRGLKSKISLGDLLEKIDRIDADFRIRISSIQPIDVSKQLIDVISKSSKICPHMHLSLQSGDNTILKSMNRQYTQEQYIKLVEDLKRKIPKICITTDIIAGFPGEKEEYFNNTVCVVKKTIPARVHVFPYSARLGTKAAELPQKIDARIIRQRVDKLKAVSKDTFTLYAKGFLGYNVRVLIEKKTKDGYIGYTDEYLPAVIVRAKGLKIGEFFTGKVSRVKDDCVIVDK